MLTYADVYCRMLTYADVQVQMGGADASQLDMEQLVEDYMSALTQVLVA